MNGSKRERRRKRASLRKTWYYGWTHKSYDRRPLVPRRVRERLAADHERRAY